MSFLVEGKDLMGNGAQLKVGGPKPRKISYFFFHRNPHPRAGPTRPVLALIAPPPWAIALFDLHKFGQSEIIISSMPGFRELMYQPINWAPLGEHFTVGAWLALSRSLRRRNGATLENPLRAGFESGKDSNHGG